ncbi:MAG: hypothetical protein KBC95_04070 [Candidatus Peribacteraceae bacterium]|nr:hypothetical protein [Candidatus Peribacteraceae bacterium]
MPAVNSVAALVAAYVAQAVKTVRTVVVDYEVELTGPIADYFNGDGSSGAVRATFQRAIRGYAKDAYIEGIRDGKGNAEDFDDEDADVVDAWIDEQLSHVDGLIDALRATEGAQDRTAAQQGILTRVRYWVNALADLGGRGKLRAMEGEMAYWRLGYTEVHCDDCLRNSRARPKRIRKWIDGGTLPRSYDLKCGGYNCDCTLRSARTDRILYPVN